MVVLDPGGDFVTRDGVYFMMQEGWVGDGGLLSLLSHFFIRSLLHCRFRGCPLGVVMKVGLEVIYHQSGDSFSSAVSIV